MDTLLPELAALLGAATALPVRVAPPASGTDGVFIWPWRTTIDQTSRLGNPPARGLGAIRRPAPIEIGFLLVVQQSDSAQAVSTLISCGHALDASPVLRGGGNEGRVMVMALSHLELCNIFLAAALPLQPCLSYSLTVVTDAFDQGSSS